MNLLLLLALLCHAGEPHFPVFRCDVVEINHVYNEQANRVLSQVICWKIHPDGQMHVQQWVRHEPHMQPVVGRNGVSLIIWRNQSPVRIEASSFTETWTQWDKEIIDRDHFPTHLRRGWPSPFPPPLPAVTN